MPAGKSVFLGNIPYNLTEEEVKEILSTAGTVTKFRLMINPDTGKPKGYGFADFADSDSAASAVRNLNDHEVMGRKIRVDWPHSNERDSPPPDYSQEGGILPGQTQQQSSVPLPPLPPGVDVPPNLTCPDAISRTLASLPPPQVLDMLAQMKALVVSDPGRATELLKQAPQLAYAMFQALLLMNLVDQNVLGAVVEQTAPQIQAQPPPAAAAAAQAPVNPYQDPYVAMQAPAPQYMQPPPQAAPPPQGPIQEDLLKQVMAIPQFVIDQLPPMERSQIMMLREQARQGALR